MQFLAIFAIDFYVKIKIKEEKSLKRVDKRNSDIIHRIILFDHQ